MPREECRSFATRSATRNHSEKPHRQLRAARVYVAVCFYDSYLIAVIVAIAPEKVEQFVWQTVST